MTQTPNFQLNQWSGTDYVRRTDFNADNLKIDTALGQLLPRGCILLWSGAADAIPAGFALCDGENGTPDLRGRFVVGAGNSDYPVGATGGTAVHAKGTGTELAKKFFGVSLAAEKELIFILSAAETRKPIMKAIMEKAGMQTDAQALAFSLPVTDLAGLRQFGE